MSSEAVNNKFSCWCKLLKSAIKTDRHTRLESVDDNFKHQPKQFGDNVSKFRKNRGAMLSFKLSVLK
jgi:hypothetical protein